MTWVVLYKSTSSNPKEFKSLTLNTRKNCIYKLQIMRKYRHYIINIDLLDLALLSIGINYISVMCKKAYITVFYTYLHVL